MEFEIYPAVDSQVGAYLASCDLNLDCSDHCESYLRNIYITASSSQSSPQQHSWAFYIAGPHHSNDALSLTILSMINMKEELAVV